MFVRYLLATLLVMLGAASMAQCEEDPVPRDRAAMVAEIEALFTRLRTELGGREVSPRVLDALRSVPRHELVPEEERAPAYRNRPLAIGHGQTISQPFIVALMTDLLELEPHDRVLEVGTGSGYQAAVLAELAREVYSIEVVEELAEKAKRDLGRLGYANVTVRAGDGYAGWPEHAPFDAIIVTAAPDHIPAQLVEQLRPGGRLVIPVGGLSQDLMVVEKKADGTTTSTEVIPVRFVPLTRGGATTGGK
jgi:protein-L-isoaspartate(D-aspartate) O-methyltransferase